MMRRFICALLTHQDVLIFPWVHCTRCDSSVRVPR